jgi:hypothetical protein
MRKVPPLVLWLALGLALGLAVAGLDPSGPPFSGLPAYLLLAALGSVAAWGAWRWVGGQSQSKLLIACLLSAVVLRLTAAVALPYGLPAFGYPESVQQSGYLYYDAFRRDSDAWHFSISNKPLIEAFNPDAGGDQYGGLLYLSAAVYRQLSPTIHRPLLIAVLGACLSSIALLFLWGFCRPMFGEKAAVVAVWIVALYPDLVLLSASQMREPYLVAGMAVAFFGFARARRAAWGDAAIALGLGTLLTLSMSPPFCALMILLLGGAWFLDRGMGKGTLAVGIGVAVVALAALAFTLRAWTSIGGIGGSKPLEVLLGWLTSGASYQLQLVEKGSSWIQRLFAVTPAWLHMPMVTLYGLTQPFLPAALADPAAPVWRVLAIFRSLGWALLLPMLAYGLAAAMRAPGKNRMAFYLALAGVAISLAVSYRSAGDLWDNPRYRASFIIVLASVAGWAWAHAAGQGRPWLKRFFVLEAGIMALFLQWYVGRYYHLALLSLYPTLLLILAFAVIYPAAALIIDQRRTAAAGGSRLDG